MRLLPNVREAFLCGQDGRDFLPVQSGKRLANLADGHRRETQPLKKNAETTPGIGC